MLYAVRVSRAHPCLMGYRSEGKPVCFVCAPGMQICVNSDFKYAAANYILCKRSGGLSVCLCIAVVPQGLAYSQGHAQDMSHQQERMCSVLRYPRHTITHS